MISTQRMRLSVAEYHRMIDQGLFNSRRVELLDGIVVDKMTHNPPHDGTIQLVESALRPVRSLTWCIRIQSAITLATSEPQPDLCVARGHERTYLTHHPRAADIGLVIEVADSTLQADRQDKAKIYGEAGIGEYWIVNLVDRQVEVYTNPSGATASPGYAKQHVHDPGSMVSLTLNGTLVGLIPVADLLP